MIAVSLPGTRSRTSLADGDANGARARFDTNRGAPRA